MCCPLLALSSSPDNLPPITTGGIQHDFWKGEEEKAEAAEACLTKSAEKTLESRQPTTPSLKFKFEQVVVERQCGGGGGKGGGEGGEKLLFPRRSAERNRRRRNPYPMISLRVYGSTRPRVDGTGESGGLWNKLSPPYLQIRIHTVPFAWCISPQ